MSSSDVSSVINYFATANEGFSTTLASTISPGASTVPLNSVAGLTNGKVFVGIVEPGATAEQVFTGTVNIGSAEITGVVWTRGANVGHASGVTVVDYVTGTALNMLTTGILKQHTQTGAHSGVTYPGGMTTDTLTVTSGTNLPAGDIGTADIADNGVTGSKLATNAIELGYAQITSNTSTNSGTFVAVAGLTTTVTVPSGGRDVKITVELPSLALATTGGGWAIAIYKDGSPIQQAVRTQDVANYVIPITVIAKDTAPSAGSHTYAIFWGVTSAGQVLSLTANAGTSTSVGTPGPAFVLAELI